MRSLMMLTVVAVAASGAFAQPPTPAAGQSGGRGGQPVQPIQQVRPGLYVVAGAGANSIVRVTTDGVILVDGKLSGEENYNALLAQIKTVTDKPVRYLIVTHHHADHTGNNDRFLAAGVKVIAHENLNKNLETYQFAPRPAKANVTYHRGYILNLGGARVEVHHFGRSHTSGDSVVYFPDLKVVAMSDALTTAAQGPLIDYAGGGSALEWRQVFDDVLKLDITDVIPGNGPILGVAYLRSYQMKFDTIVDRLTALVRQGVPKDQLLTQLKIDDIGWAPRIPSIDAAYTELSGR